MLLVVLYVGAGGFFGAILRYILTLTSNNSSKSSFPTRTLVVNLFACFILGLISQFLNLSAEFNMFFITGFLGSLSTFSTFILDIQKLSRKEKFSSIIYLSLSIGLGLLSFEVGSSIYALF
ncbi:CrcB family protein [Candidatus Lokiarchaeum ossiferum]|uniref:CrcB family protein n=1 Tax=Candidatus Lokiarchaeum ossiferum TaxID=2951803 RepID=UPI00352F2084